MEGLIGAGVGILALLVFFFPWVAIALCAAFLVAFGLAAALS